MKKTLFLMPLVVILAGCGKGNGGQTKVSEEKFYSNFLASEFVLPVDYVDVSAHITTKAVNIDEAEEDIDEVDNVRYTWVGDQFSFDEEAAERIEYAPFFTSSDYPMLFEKGSEVTYYLSPTMIKEYRVSDEIPRVTLIFDYKYEETTSYYFNNEQWVSKVVFVAKESYTYAGKKCSYTYKQVATYSYKYAEEF